MGSKEIRVGREFVKQMTGRGNMREKLLFWEVEPGANERIVLAGVTRQKQSGGCCKSGCLYSVLHTFVPMSLEIPRFNHEMFPSRLENERLNYVVKS